MTPDELDSKRDFFVLFRELAHGDKQMLDIADRAEADWAAQNAPTLIAAARAVERVRELHHRRPHQPFDFITHGQTEFPDLCGCCRRPYPCPTLRALDGE